MLKKILGEAPYKLSLEGGTFVVPDKKTLLTLVFESSIEYDLPLSCCFKIVSSVATDMCQFDVVLPAEGKTKQSIKLSVPDGSKIIGKVGVAELEIVDRILDSRTEYEIKLTSEMAYKCGFDKVNAFSTSDDAVYTRNGRFYGNKEEIISLEIPSIEDYETELRIVSGNIKDYDNGQRILLKLGINRLAFEMSDDTCFEFSHPVSGEQMFLPTVIPKYFLQEK